MTRHLYHYDRTLGLIDPIIYLSDFWVLMRDLIILDTESMERIRKVRSGEPELGTDEMTDIEKENLNYQGKLFLSWDNYSSFWLIYQQ